MPVRINVGLSKKVGQQNFGSLGAVCNVEFEIDGGYDNGSTDRFQDAVRRAYAACREAVESELAAHDQSSKPQLEGQHQAPATNRIANQSSGSKARGATTSQVRAIHAIANRSGIDLPGILSQFNVSRPDDLSIGHASLVIDQLKNPGGTAVSQ